MENHTYFTQSNQVVVSSESHVQPSVTGMILGPYTTFSTYPSMIQQIQSSQSIAQQYSNVIPHETSTDETDTTDCIKTPCPVYKLMGGVKTGDILDVMSALMKEGSVLAWNDGAKKCPFLKLMERTQGKVKQINVRSTENSAEFRITKCSKKTLQSMQSEDYSEHSANTEGEGYSNHESVEVYSHQMESKPIAMHSVEKEIVPIPCDTGPSENDFDTKIIKTEFVTNDFQDSAAHDSDKKVVNNVAKAEVTDHVEGYEKIPQIKKQKGITVRKRRRLQKTETEGKPNRGRKKKKLEAKQDDEKVLALVKSIRAGSPCQEGENSNVFFVM